MMLLFEKNMTVLRAARLLAAIAFVGLALTALVSARPGTDLSLANLASKRNTDLELFNPNVHVTSLDARAFEFFDGITASAVAFGVTFATIAIGCFIGTAGAGSALCVLGAIALTLAAGNLGQKIQAHRGGGGRTHNLTIDGSQTTGILSFRDHIGLNGLTGGYVVGTKQAEKEWDAYHEAEYRRVFNSTVKHYGWITKNDTVHGRLVPDGFQAWPIYEFHDQHGNRVHHVEFYDGSGKFHRGRMWWPDAPDADDEETSHLDKRITKSFEHKYHFKQGGLDSHVHKAEQSGHTDQADFQHFEDIVKCYVNQQFLKSRRGLWSQTYNANSQETVSCIAVAAVGSDGTSGIGGMQTCPTPVKTTHNCGKKYHTNG